MGIRVVSAGLMIVSVCGVSALPASASTPEPVIMGFQEPTFGTAGTEVTIKGTNLAGAIKVTFNGTIATVIHDTAKKIIAYVPAGATSGYIKVKTPGGTATSHSGFTVQPPLEDATSVVGGCAVLTSGGVDCWGGGYDGQLGDGQFYTTGYEGVSVPVQVEGVGGTGTLTGVAALTDEGSDYCALLTSGGVDCWGYGEHGELGDGQFYTTGNDGSAVPVQVEGVGGTGTLTGVTALEGDCALLTSGGVDCWGYGGYGSLGDGQFDNSAVPVQVEGVGGTGTLTGVAALTDADGNCALLTSGGVDCWGHGELGELGDGQFYTSSDNFGSAVPVQVEGVGGTGTLTGVADLTDEYGGFCAVLTSGGVDCWGYGSDGELGDGQFVNSAVPVQVEGVGGTGTLNGVTALTDDSTGFCALLTSGGVDCWGEGGHGSLGDGQFVNSAVPVQVEGVGGTGTLSGAAGLSTEGGIGTYCALVTSGGVDCWGWGLYGALGDGQFYITGNEGSAVPVQVEAVGGAGTLTSVADLANIGDAFCALVTSGGIDCWGYGLEGELGNGEFYTSIKGSGKHGFEGSAVPVEVG